MKNIPMSKQTIVCEHSIQNKYFKIQGKQTMTIYVFVNLIYYSEIVTLFLTKVRQAILIWIKAIDFNEGQ